jgi:hypothetical protein
MLLLLLIVSGRLTFFRFQLSAFSYQPSAFRIVIKPSVDWDGYAQGIAALPPAAHYPVVYRRPYQVNPVGVLILGRASRLDAFSAYRFWT